MPWNQTRSREIPRISCLRGFAGRDSIMSAFFDATTLSANSEGRYEVAIGSFLTKSTTDPTKVKVFEALGENVNAKQTLTETAATGGTFTIEYGGVKTAAIKYNATAEEIQTALIALSTIATSENVAVTIAETKKLSEKPAIVEFKGELGNQAQPLLVISTAGLVGEGATIVPTTTTAGKTAEEIIGVFDGPEKEFWGNTVSSNEPIPVYFHGCDFDITKLPQWTKYGLLAKKALTTCTFR